MIYLEHGRVMKRWNIDVFPTPTHKLRTRYCFSKGRAEEIVHELEQKYPKGNIYLMETMTRTSKVSSGHGLDHDVYISDK